MQKILILLPLITGCSMLGLVNVPEPEYRVLLEEKSKNVTFQIRDYSELLLAETIVEEDFRKAGNVGFKRLGGYIFGDNKEDKKIQMTAPVLLDRNAKNKSWKMVFILPEGYTLEKAPTPINQNVSIKKMKRKRFAVAKFSGSLSEENFDKHSAQLLEWMKTKNYKAVSSPIFAGYNPPLTPFFLRRNEVFVEINRE